MAVLLVAEARNAGSIDAAARALTALNVLGEIDVLSVGSSPGTVEIAKLEGVSKVLHIDDDGHGLAEGIADVIVALKSGYTHIASPATSFSKDLLPRVAALIDVMVIPDVTAILDAETFERPVYAGNAIQTVKSSDAVKILTIRASGFSAAPAGSSRQVEEVSFTPSDLTSWVEDVVVASDRPDLASAKIVVSGGRGVGSKESFQIIEQLADRLGAAVGASRAAVDSGYAPNDWQVGQTGKIVAPQLYVAVGISGAIQHLAGMKDSKIIVAINKDEDAPIFQIADYALVGDLFTVVPELIQKL
jgi:electron transfer flavoprotein alpha subunit